MADVDGRPCSQSVIRAVVRRFPNAEFAIRRLMRRSESFCDMCEELMEADFALSKVEDVPPAFRDIRRAEWQGLVDRSIVEIAMALRSDGVSV